MTDMGPASLAPYLAVSSMLFACGVLAVAARRNAIGVLLGLELLLNAAALQFTAYGRFHLDGVDVQGQAAALLVIVVAAAEAAVALAIFLNFYNNFATVDVERGDSLKG